MKLAVQIPYPLAQANQLPHKFTLANDDSSYSKTLTLASDCTAGDVDGTSLVTFTDLTDGHTYTLQCDDGTQVYSMFENVPYDLLVQQLAGQGGGTPGGSGPASGPSSAPGGT